MTEEKYAELKRLYDKRQRLRMALESLRFECPEIKLDDENLASWGCEEINEDLICYMTSRIEALIEKLNREILKL